MQKVAHRDGNATRAHAQDMAEQRQVQATNASAGDTQSVSKESEQYFERIRSRRVVSQGESEVNGRM